MKLGFVSDTLAHLTLEAALDVAVGQGLQGVEVNTGNWSSAPHFDLPVMKVFRRCARRFPPRVRKPRVGDHRAECERQSASSGYG